MKTYSLQEINAVLKGTVSGNTNQNITAPEQLEEASNTEISFIGNKKYEKFWATSNACVAVVNENISIEPGENRAFIKVKNADLAMSQVLELFAPPTPLFHVDIHPTATIDSTAKISNGVKIGAGCYVGPKVEIKENATLYPNVTILDECTIGKNTTIWSGTVVRERCHIGNDCIIHPNATIGADGFGFTPNEKGEFIKVPQTGNVIIESNVDIGAGTTIDRATLGSTIIRSGVKLDNQIQIAHNVEIGKNTVIAAQTGIAGSAKIGENCQIGGQVGIVGHISIGNNVKIQAQSGIGRNVKDNEVLQGSPALSYGDYNKSYVYFKNLPKIVKQLESLEKKEKANDK